MLTDEAMYLPSSFTLLSVSYASTVNLKRVKRAFPHKAFHCGEANFDVEKPCRAKRQLRCTPKCRASAASAKQQSAQFSS